MTDRNTSRTSDATIDREGDAVADQHLIVLKHDAAAIGERAGDIVVNENRVAGAVDVVIDCAVAGHAVQLRETGERMIEAAVLPHRGGRRVDVPDRAAVDVDGN